MPKNDTSAKRELSVNSTGNTAETLLTHRHCQKTRKSRAFAADGCPPIPVLNLQTTPLHWFAFNALFEGLPEKSSTKQRIAYRCINIGCIKDKEERKRILQIQRAIAIPQKPMTAAEVGSLFG